MAQLGLSHAVTDASQRSHLSGPVQSPQQPLQRLRYIGRGPRSGGCWGLGVVRVGGHTSACQLLVSIMISAHRRIRYRPAFAFWRPRTGHHSVFRLAPLRRRGPPCATQGTGPRTRPRRRAASAWGPASRASRRAKARPVTPAPGARARCTRRAARTCPGSARIGIVSLSRSGVLGPTLRIPLPPPLHPHPNPPCPKPSRLPRRGPSPLHLAPSTSKHPTPHTALRQTPPPPPTPLLPSLPAPSPTRRPCSAPHERPSPQPPPAITRRRTPLRPDRGAGAGAAAGGPRRPPRRPAKRRRTSPPLAPHPRRWVYGWLIAPAGRRRVKCRLDSGDSGQVPA